MRFLVVSKVSPLPRELAIPLLEAHEAYCRAYLSNGKFEQVFAFAASSGGGCITEVDSLEELDAIMSEYPLGPFSQTEVYPLMDLFDSIANVKRSIQKRA
jgi:muconolactone delta-isomerase